MFTGIVTEIGSICSIIRDDDTLIEILVAFETEKIVFSFFSAFLKHLKANNIDTGQLMQNIEDVIIKVLIYLSFVVFLLTYTNLFIINL
mgnify:CR=1 FL=1